MQCHQICLKVYVKKANRAASFFLDPLISMGVEIKSSVSPDPFLFPSPNPVSHPEGPHVYVHGYPSFVYHHGHKKWPLGQPWGCTYLQYSSPSRLNSGKRACRAWKGLEPLGQGCSKLVQEEDHGVWVGTPTWTLQALCLKENQRTPLKFKSRSDALVTCIWGQHCICHLGCKTKGMKALWIQSWEFGKKRIKDELPKYELFPLTLHCHSPWKFHP